MMAIGMFWRATFAIELPCIWVFFSFAPLFFSFAAYSQRGIALISQTLTFRDFTPKQPHFSAYQTPESYNVLNYVGRQPGKRWKSWVADWTVPLGPPRTILSVLGQEDAHIRKIRKAHVRQNNSWTRGNLISVGRVVGIIRGPSPEQIHLSVQGEEDFKQIRDDFKGDEHALESRLLQQWRGYPFGFSWGRRQPRNIRKHRFWPFKSITPSGSSKSPSNKYHTPRISSDDDGRVRTSNSRRRKGKERQSNLQQQNDSSNSKTSIIREEHKLPHKGRLTIEAMLVLRSRSTVTWSSDISDSERLVFDESSVLEGRSIAIYSPIKSLTISNTASPSKSANDLVALVPQSTKAGDMIIALKGARLPFVVRNIAHLRLVDHQSSTSLLCEFVGECFVNEYKKLDSVFVPEVERGGNEDRCFVFGSMDPEHPDSDTSEDSKISEDSENFEAFQIPQNLQSLRNPQDSETSEMSEISKISKESEESEDF